MSPALFSEKVTLDKGGAVVLPESRSEPRLERAHWLWWLSTIGDLGERGFGGLRGQDHAEAAVE